jgi:hypothetical protein
MNILDVAFLTIQVPVLEHARSLRNQFERHIAGCEKELDEIYKKAGHIVGQPLSLRMVYVESASLIGSPHQDLLYGCCKAIELDMKELVNPSIAQVGAVAELFREEENVQRAIPLKGASGPLTILWQRSEWPGKKSPIIKCHQGESKIHGCTWMMLPTAVK